MQVITVEEKNLGELLVVLGNLSHAGKSEVIDTWDHPITNDCTNCANVIKYKRKVYSKITEINPGGCKAKINFLIQENVPVPNCEFYTPNWKEEI